MSRTRISLSAGFPFIFLFYLAPTPSLATTFVVAQDGSGNFTTIQPAINACTHGDTVRVLAGTYTGTANKNLDFGGVNLHLIAPSGPAATVIDCENDGRGSSFQHGETSDATVEGFTIRNGHAPYEGNGGGFFCQDSPGPTVTNCVVSHCVGSYGGGMYCLRSHPTLAGIVIEDCTAGTHGGAIYLEGGSAVHANACAFRGNTAGGFGGAISAVYSDAVVTDCTLEGNSAMNGGGGSWIAYSAVTITNCRILTNTGGGVLFLGVCPAVFRDCAIERNTARFSGAGITGGASGPPSFINCRIAGNDAAGDGGGIAGGDATFDGCLVTGNRAAGNGGGVSAEGGVLTFTGTTIARNEAGGTGGNLNAGGTSNLALTRVIVWAGCGTDDAHVSGAATVRFECCAEDPSRITGPGQIQYVGDQVHADPLLCDLPACGSVPTEVGDFGLSDGSPCLPESSPCGLLIGALGLNCSASPVETTTWGRIKAAYR